MLIDEVQALLLQIAQLSHATAAAVKSRNEPLISDLDRQVEKLLGEKERAMGALRQHRKDHGC